MQKVTLGWFCFAESSNFYLLLGLNRFKQLGNSQNKLKKDW